MSNSSCSGGCAAGYSCGAGSTSATQLPCGSAAVYCTAGSSIATPVEGGMYSVSCINSSGGYDTTTCSAQASCEAGYYCLSGRRVECSVGSFSVANQSACTPCPTGHHQNQTGQAFCVPCPPLYGQPIPGQIECDPCPSGYYTPAGLGQCVPCVEPNIVTGDGTNCSSFFCLRGHHWNVSAMKCVECEIGTYSNETGSVLNCIRAPINTYVPKPGATEALSCTKLKGVYCVNGTAYSQDGYWMYVWNNETGEVRAELCLEGYCEHAEGSTFQCASNRQQSANNVLCGHCEPGYTDWQGDCLRCTSTAALAQFVLWLVTFLNMLGVHLFPSLQLQNGR